MFSKKNLTLPQTSIASENPKIGYSCSNHSFSGVNSLLVSGRVYPKISGFSGWHLDHQSYSIGMGLDSKHFPSISQSASTRALLQSPGLHRQGFCGHPRTGPAICLMKILCWKIDAVNVIFVRKNILLHRRFMYCTGNVWYIDPIHIFSMYMHIHYSF